MNSGDKCLCGGKSQLRVDGGDAVPGEGLSMAFRIVCFLLCMAGLLVSGFLFYRNPRKKVWRWVALGALCLSFAVLGTFRGSSVEFPTQEEAIRHLLRGEVVDIVEGKHSSFVITAEVSLTEGPQFANHYLIKTDKGYRLATFFETQDQTIMMDSGMFVSVCSIEGTGDQYAYGFYPQPAGEKTVITDTNGTVFRKAVMETHGESDIVFAYACVGPVGDDYGVDVQYKAA